MTREERDIAAQAREEIMLTALRWIAETEVAGEEKVPDELGVGLTKVIGPKHQRTIMWMRARDALERLKSAQGSPSAPQTTPASSEPQTAASEAINEGRRDYEPLFSTEWERLDYRRMKYGLPPLGPLAKRA